MSNVANPRSYFERWQRLEADKKAIADDLKELFAEAKASGLEPKALRIAFRNKVKAEKETKEDQELAALVELYSEALDEPEPRARARAREADPSESQAKAEDEAEPTVKPSAWSEEAEDDPVSRASGGAGTAAPSSPAPPFLPGASDGERAKRGEPQRFLEEALAFTGDGCVIWPFSCDAGGYARIQRGDTHALVSQLVCEAVNGPRPSPEHGAIHSCGRGHEACIAPRHIRWGTQAENCQDAIQHGTFARGERHGRAKLSEQDIREIRAVGDAVPRGDLARRFGVHPHTINLIRSGKRWAHVAPEGVPGQSVQAVASNSELPGVAEIAAAPRSGPAGVPVEERAGNNSTNAGPARIGETPNDGGLPDNGPDRAGDSSDEIDLTPPDFLRRSNERCNALGVR